MKYVTIIASLLLILPILAAAQNYTPLVKIPEVSNGDFGSYVNALYYIAISIAALLAVVKIIIAGVKWMMTDVVPNKEGAKKDIQGALLGLLVILAAVLILNVINPSLGDATITFEGTGFVAGPSVIQAVSSTESAIATCAQNNAVCNVFRCESESDCSDAIASCTENKPNASYKQTENIITCTNATRNNVVVETTNEIFEEGSVLVFDFNATTETSRRANFNEVNDELLSRGYEILSSNNANFEVPSDQYRYELNCKEEKGGTGVAYLTYSNITSQSFCIK